MAADTAEMVAARGAAVVSTREDDDDVGVSDEEAEYEDEEGQEAIETEDPVLWQLLSTTHAASPARPVLATTRKPRRDSSDIATLPTPPLAPVTSTGPLSGVRPWRCSAVTHSMAV